MKRSGHAGTSSGRRRERTRRDELTASAPQRRENSDCTPVTAELKIVSKT